MIRRSKSDWALGAIVILLLVLFAVWTYGPAHEFDWKFDEGPDVTKASLLLQGERLYSDMWADHPPLFTMTLAAAFAVFGQEVIVARLLVLAFALLGLASIFILSRILLKDYFSLVPMLLLLLLPHFQSLSRLVLIGLPAISVGLAALAAAALYHVKRRPLWLVLTGVLFACSLLIKLITVPMFPALCALIWLPPRQAVAGRKPWRELLLLGLIMLVPLALALAYGGRGLIEQVVGLLFKARGTQARSLAANAPMVAEYLSNDKWGLSHLGMVGLAAVGLASLASRRSWNWLVFLGLWLSGVLLALLWQTPLRSHELVLIMPPMAVSAGVGAQAAFQGLWRWRSTATIGRVMALAGCVVAMLILVWVPAMARADIEQRDVSMGLREKTASRQAVIQFLSEQTPPGSTIITDDPMLTFLARRDIPPELVVSSYKRIQAGELSLEEMIRSTEQAQPAAIVLWRGGLERVAGYQTWVEANYCLIHAYEDGQRLYVPRPTPPDYVEQPARSEVGLAFLGSAIRSFAVDPGQRLDLTLYWQADRQVTEDYTLFVHLLDPAGERLAGEDLQPLDAEFETSDWLPGQMIAQEVALTVPMSAAPGPKLVAVGLYDAQKDRLAFVDGAGEPLASSQIILTPKPIVRWPGNYETPAMQHPYRAQFGASVQLLGYDAPESLSPADRQIEIVFYWQCLQPMRTSYTVFAHLLDESDAIVAQQDQQPGAGQFPTTGWAPGEVLADTCLIPLPDGLAAGSYRLRFGMYDLQTGARLAANDEERQIAGDHILLSSLLQVAR